jgi:transposase-like protein
MPKQKEPKFAITEQPHFSDPDKAREYMEAQRWPEGPVCPHCGLIGNAYRLEPKEGAHIHARKGLLKCGGCREQFSVTVGTIFEDSHIPLNKWLLVIHLMCASKKGISANQIHRMLGITYKSAWFMCHRIRYAMTQEPLSSKLGAHAAVEVDETYVGGREKGKRGMPGPESKKTAVVALVEKGGRVHSRTVTRVTVKNLKPIFSEMLAENAEIHTDEAVVYSFLKGERMHKTVNHAKEEYARREPDGRVVTTNTVESFFALVKRANYGTHHFWSRHQMHRYLAEIDFRYNSRGEKDEERAKTALHGADGRRLMYRDSCGRIGGGGRCAHRSNS